MAIQMTQPTPKRVNRFHCAGCGAKMALRELCANCRAIREEARMWAAIGYWLPTMQRQMDAYLAQYEAGLPDPEPEPPAPNLGACVGCGQPATCYNDVVCSDHLDEPMCAACYAKDAAQVQANVARERAERQGKHWNWQTKCWEPEQHISYHCARGNHRDCLPYDCWCMCHDPAVADPDWQPLPFVERKEPESPAPLVAEPVKLYLRSRWERKSHYHQVASARRAEKRGLYVVNRMDETLDWEGHFGGDAA